MAKNKEAPATEEAPEGAVENTEGGEGGDIKKKAKKKLMIIIGGVVVFLIIAGAGAFFMLGKKEAPEGEAATEQAEGGEHGEAPKEGEHGAEGEGKEGKEALNKKLYLNIGEFLVNLNSASKQASFLKMSVTLEVMGEANKKAVEENLPRIKDTFQTYLRELRAEDLKGSAGIYRLREALLLRVNKVVHPGQVTDILFEEMIVQ